MEHSRTTGRQARSQREAPDQQRRAGPCGPRGSRSHFRRIFEGFHYLHHPVNLRLRELVTSGALGQIRRVDLVLAIPAPPDTDPRWSRELSGGGTMDLGCYVLDAARTLGLWIAAAPQIVSVDAPLREPEVDASMRVELAYPGGVTGHCLWDMDAAERTMPWSVTGTDGVATSPAFAVPHMENRLRVTRHGRTTEEVLGGQTSYTCQLARIDDSCGAASPSRRTSTGPWPTRS